MPFLRVKVWSEKQLHPGFELGLLIPFSVIMTITLSELPYKIIEMCRKESFSLTDFIGLYTPII